MAKMKRRLTKRELNDLQKIDELIQSTKKQDNQKSKPELIEKVVEAQQVKKETRQKQMLRYGGNEINLEQLQFTDHSIKRAVERLELDKNSSPNEVCKYVKKLLLKAEYLGRITATDGCESDMFILGKHSIHYQPAIGRVTTVLKYDKLPYNPAQNKIRSLMHKEFRKLDRTEKAKIRQLELHRLEIANEISELKLRKFKTRSTSVKLSCKARIKALEDGLIAYESQLNDVRSQKRQVAYAYASI